MRICLPGEWLELVREPDNEHDHLAIAVVTGRDVRVGYVGRDRAAWIAPKIDRGYLNHAIVERVKGIHLDGATLGLVMRINMDGKEPELPVSGDRSC
ncbi:HIRAN domain-containing protein [Sphingomonas beigongshangi]|uniref:HIRAN domain-containing protein n=1 Tax=Sphingomonas beigongshangi TaxID=2782540 RepID=UPI001FF0482D|nr:HIRAN domain-containing protein [Sphingomonas beigongshangi]